jgi:hypothetical protein
MLNGFSFEPGYASMPDYRADMQVLCHPLRGGPGTNETWLDTKFLMMLDKCRKY